MFCRPVSSVDQCFVDQCAMKTSVFCRPASITGAEMAGLLSLCSVDQCVL